MGEDGFLRERRRLLGLPAAVGTLAELPQFPITCDCGVELSDIDECAAHECTHTQTAAPGGSRHERTEGKTMTTGPITRESRWQGAGDRQGPMSDAEARGTYECPHCGFDKPHTHGADLLRWFEEAKTNPRYDVASQRRQARREAEAEHDQNLRKAEFDADPIAYRSKYGTINSVAGGDGVQWAFERVVSLQRELDALERESRADKALIRKLTDICPDCPPDVAEHGCETCDGSGVVPMTRFDSKPLRPIK